MTQKNSDSTLHQFDISIGRKLTRIDSAPPDLYDPNQPRLGRRESEPHSAEVTYLYDVLTTNFPSDKTLWDLHHYFIGKKGALKGQKIDLQFDVSFFKNMNIPYSISSYDASKYEGRVPDMVINVLSKNTWKNDLSENIDICKDLSISNYIVFSPYKVTSEIYAPPFLRAFILKDDGSYEQHDLRNVTLKEGEQIEEKKNIIDVSDKLPFRLGLMQLKRQYEREKPLFRIIVIDPSEPRILPTRWEKEKEEAEKKASEAEKKIKELEKNIQKYQEKFGKL